MFNRPDFTAQVWKRIENAKPEKLYIAADGPRKGTADDVVRCARVREIITSVNWNCEVHTLFSNENLGCNEAVKRAINWFFQHEPEGIILEDDCLPDPSFFRFCCELLTEYRLNENVLSITGTNFIADFPLSASYTFSRVTNIWGWASWRRAWRLYDAEMKRWPEYSRTTDLDYFGKYRDQIYDSFNSAYLSEPIYNWGIPWRLTCLLHQMFCIVPHNNLIRNLGVDHSDSNRYVRPYKVRSAPVQPIEFPLAHPVSVLPNQPYDHELRKFVSGGCDAGNCKEIPVE